MKKTLLLTTAMVFLGASSLLAAPQTVDIYITGATAFRANVYTACTKLYASAPTIYYGDAAHGGAGSGFSSKTASWCMTGTPISLLTNLSGTTLVIHGLFTGSIQGLANVENKTPLQWATPAGTSGSLTAGYVTKAATIGFSDASGNSSPYPATGYYKEEKVAIQPFVFVKSVGSGAAATALANVTGVTSDQIQYGIPQGRIPLSAWTYKAADTNTFIYLVERTKDSGTRRNLTAEQGYIYTDPFGVYIFDPTNNLWFPGTNSNNSLIGSYPNGVVGAAGIGGVNLAWGSGYVGGGDIATELGYTNSANAAIAFLSIADARSITGSATSSNWTQVLPVNGVWPSTAGAGIVGSISNNYAPITLGYYPCWGAEVLVYPTDIAAAGYTDQSVTSTQLGSQAKPGTFLGVFNAQTYINGGSPVLGSIENEIELSKGTAPGATAIRLSEMINSRAADGGVISPPLN